MKTRILRFAASTAVLVAFVLSGCAPSTKAPQPAKNAQGVQSLAVLPFKDMSALYGPSQNVRSPLSGRMYMTCAVEADAVTLLTREALGFLRNSRSFTVVPVNEMKFGKPLEPEAEMASLVEEGRKAGADGVVAGYVYCFRDRVGNAYSVETPASVAMDVFLVRVSDGKILWSGQFNETQKPLSDNLLNVSEFMKRGGKWVTAREMGTEAIRNVLANFPKARE